MLGVGEPAKEGAEEGEGEVGTAPNVQTEAAYQGLKPKQGPHTDLPLKLIVLSKKSHRVFGEYVVVSFPAPSDFEHMLGYFFASGIGVGGSGELTTRFLNLVPSIIECLRNDFDCLRIKNDRTAREFQNLSHAGPHRRTGGSAIGLSATDAWTKPLSMMAVTVRVNRTKGKDRLRGGLRQISNR